MTIPRTTNWIIKILKQIIKTKETTTKQKKTSNVFPKSSDPFLVCFSMLSRQVVLDKFLKVRKGSEQPTHPP